MKSFKSLEKPFKPTKETYDRCASKINHLSYIFDYILDDFNQEKLQSDATLIYNNDKRLDKDR